MAINQGDTSSEPTTPIILPQPPPSPSLILTPPSIVNFSRRTTTPTQPPTPIQTFFPASESIALQRNDSNRSEGINFENGRKEMVLSEFSESSDSDSELLNPLNCGFDHNSGKIAAEFNVPTKVFNLFKALYSSSEFFNSFQNLRETSEIQISDWEESGEITIRRLSYKLKLKQKFPGTSTHVRVTERQLLHRVSKPGRLYVIEIESNSYDVLLSDSFYTTYHVCLSKVNENESKLTVVANIVFRRNVFGLKRKIENAIWDGINDYYKLLETEVKKYFQQPKQEVEIEPTALQVGQISSLNTNIRRPNRRRQRRPAPPIPLRMAPPATRSMGLIAKFKFLIRNILRAIHGVRIPWIVFLKILICISSALLLCFNIYLYLRVEELESKVLQSEMFPASEIKDWREEEWKSYFKNEKILLTNDAGNWKGLLANAIKNLKYTENQLNSIRLLVKEYSKDIKY